jgi:serine/threonine protein kinase
MQGSSWVSGSQHPNVITVVGWSSAKKIPSNMKDVAKYGYVILELGHLGEVTDDFIMCTGTNLDVQAFDGEKYLKRVARDVFRGLQFMHEGGVLHRDIKPENMVNKTNNSIIRALKQ